MRKLATPRFIRAAQRLGRILTLKRHCPLQEISMGHESYQHLRILARYEANTQFMSPCPKKVIGHCLHHAISNGTFEI